MINDGHARQKKGTKGNSQQSHSDDEISSTYPSTPSSGSHRPQEACDADFAHRKIQFRVEAMM